MAKFRIQEYALYIRAYEIKAGTISEATGRINKTTPPIAEEYIGQQANVMVCVNPTRDFCDSGWMRATEIMPNLRTIENLGTGERWDCFDGYRPPVRTR